MPIALILARADEVCGMNNKPREVFLPKYAVTACINEWTRERAKKRTGDTHEKILNTLPVHVGATVAPMERFQHARTFVGRTGIVLRHLYRNVTYCIAVEVPDSIQPGDFDFDVPVWAMQGSQLVPFDAEWHESGDPRKLIEDMFRDHGRYTTGRQLLEIVMELESDSGELIQDVYNPHSRSKRLPRRVNRLLASEIGQIDTLNWTPINKESSLFKRPEQVKYWEKLRERCKADYELEETFQLQHHGWMPYDIVVPRRSVILALEDSPEGRVERDIWLGRDGFLSPITRAEHHEISLREGGPHRITPDHSFADKYHEQRYFANRQPPQNPRFSWYTVTLRRPQMLQWVKQFTYNWGEQQNYQRGFIVQSCQTYLNNKGKQITGVLSFLISLEQLSIGEARKYSGLVASIRPANPGKYISLAFDPKRKKHRRQVFEGLTSHPGICEVKLFAHPSTKQKADRAGVPKAYRFGLLEQRPVVPADGNYLGFAPFINCRGEGYVEV